LLPAPSASLNTLLPLPLGKYGQKAVRRARNSARDPALPPHCFHRKNLSFSLGRRCGYDLWLIWGGATHFQRASFSPMRRDLGFFLAVFCYPRLRHRQHHLHYWGYYNICHSERNPRSARNIPRGIFISIIASPFCILHADQHSWRVAVAASQDSLYRQCFCEKLYGSGAARFATAMVLWIAFASVFSSLLGYSASHTPRRSMEISSAFSPACITEEVPARLAPLSRHADLPLRATLQVEDRDRAVLAMRLIIQFIGQAVGSCFCDAVGLRSACRLRCGCIRCGVVTIAGWIWLFLRTGKAVWWGLFVILLGLAVFSRAVATSQRMAVRRASCQGRQ